MKKFAVILGIIGLVALIGGNFIYTSVSNPDDTGGSRTITHLEGHWTTKLPIFVGGVLFGLALVFYSAEVDSEKAAILVAQRKAA